MPEREAEYQPEGFAEIEASVNESKEIFLKLAQRGNMSSEEVDAGLAAFDQMLEKERQRLLHGEALEEDRMRTGERIFAETQRIIEEAQRKLAGVSDNDAPE